jgi:resuscitation-promoting factor RpfA
MRPKLVAVALTGGILVLGTGSVVAATLPSWTTTHTAGTMAAASSQRASAAPATSSPPPALASAAPSPAQTPMTKPDSSSARAAMPHATGIITYTVKRGDTLSGIAEWFSLHGYGALYAANESVIGSNPNLIYPGERITISHGVLTMSGTRK